MTQVPKQNDTEKLRYHFRHVIGCNIHPICFTCPFDECKWDDSSPNKKYRSAALYLKHSGIFYLDHFLMHGEVGNAKA